MYIKQNQDKFKIHRFKPNKNLQRPKLRLTVDTPEDLQVARKIYHSLSKNGRPIPLKRIINFLDKNQKISKINSKIPIGVSRVWS